PADHNRLSGYTSIFKKTLGDRVFVKLVYADEDGLAEKDLLERFRDDPVLRQDDRNIIIRLVEAVEIVSGGTRVLALVFPVVKPVLLNGLTQAQLARIRTSLRNAVEFLHENGFAHHDIKPANLGMVTDSPSEPAVSGSLVLLDLGLMLHYSDPSRGSAGYRGTEEYLPQGYTRTSWRGWHPFELDDYAVNVTLRKLGAKATRATTTHHCGAMDTTIRSGSR
ncbi:hypothetical protein HK405_000377, partial [Cladochytrium tenue]